MLYFQRISSNQVNFQITEWIKHHNNRMSTTNISPILCFQSKLSPSNNFSLVSLGTINFWSFVWSLNCLEFKLYSRLRRCCRNHRMRPSGQASGNLHYVYEVSYVILHLEKSKKRFIGAKNDKIKKKILWKLLVSRIILILQMKKLRSKSQLCDLPKVTLQFTNIELLNSH